MGSLSLFVVLLAMILCLCHSSQLCFAKQGYQKKALDLHNRYRAKHHSPALQMDKNLNRFAVQCADYYARKGTSDHSCPHKQGSGENLYIASGSWTGERIAESSTNAFYNENTKYRYSQPGFKPSTGHFTAMVWKSSQRFGFGFASVRGRNVAVALYNNHGNVRGRFRENVLRP